MSERLSSGRTDRTDPHIGACRDATGARVDSNYPRVHEEKGPEAPNLSYVSAPTGRNGPRLPLPGELVWPLDARTGRRKSDRAGRVWTVYRRRGLTVCEVSGYRSPYPWFALEYADGGRP